MNMKKNLFFLLFLFILVGGFSCKDQDGVYREFVEKGGYVYPQKTKDFTIYEGYKRIKLVWNIPTDPSVRTAKVFWSNRTKEIDINYETYPGKQVELFIENLEEMSYTFELINFDSDGNKSMVSEVTGSPYAENWLLTHAERTISSAEMKGPDATIITGYGTDEMIATRFRYLNADNDTIILDDVLKASDNSIVLPNAISGKRFEFNSCYCPSEGLDTVWGDWKKSPNPISGLLDSKLWDAKVTTGQVWSSAYLASFVFDGIIDRTHRWCSAQGSIANVFPKIMVVDAMKESFYINKIMFYQDQATMNLRYGKTVEIYWGNEPFNPDAGNDYENSPEFAKAIADRNVYKTTWWYSTATWTFGWSEMVNFRYFAIIWKDSRSGSGYIDLWEMQFYGYDSSVD